MKTIAYEEKFGEIEFPEGFEEKLRGKSIEEQMKYYRISTSSTFSRTSYGEVDSQKVFENTKSLDEDKHCIGLVVKDGLLVGVLIKEWWGSECVCLPYHRICVYYASDNEGSGTNDCADYASLICV